MKNVRTFAFHFGTKVYRDGRLSDSIRVVQRFLVPFVLVRIQVGQQVFSDCEYSQSDFF